MRDLCLSLGDQLDRQTPLLERFNSATDSFWLAECHEEAAHVWSHKARISVFFAGMRHFADELRDVGHPVIYHRITDGLFQSLSSALTSAIEEHRPESVRVVQPGSHRVQRIITDVCEATSTHLVILDDPSFFTTPTDFAEWADGRKELRLEYFYRVERKRYSILIDSDGKPEGGSWNFDKSNRGSFGKQGPGMLDSPQSFSDAIVEEAIEDVERLFPGHPGSLEHFNWPVTPTQAEAVLDDFVAHRLVAFGEYQDAMWTDEPFLYHSLLSAALNLKLIRPHMVVDAAVRAYNSGRAPIEAVEGFVRQILGWREYVRGLYWLKMPEYFDGNALDAQAALPAFFWDADTELECQRQAIDQTLEHGYAHHIQRLMVTGLFCLLLGVKPEEVHVWYLAVYVDAVEWVEVPNVLGMSQYADGGVMASKPYIASGKYIQRMSNYCDGCKFDPAKKVGDDACPITTLYWDFLQRHEDLFSEHPRLKLQWRNLSRLDADELKAIRDQAQQWRDRWANQETQPEH